MLGKKLIMLRSRECIPHDLGLIGVFGIGLLHPHARR